MNAVLKSLVLASSVAVLASCASSGGLSGDASTQAADAFGTSGSGGISGGYVGGPTATLQQRTIYFSYDSAEVSADSQPVVEAHARYLIENPSAAVILEGHADERGTREYNIGLGERRADSVRRLMGAMGVQPQQMRSVSYGEERPAVYGSDEQSYGLNRRVEVTY